MFATKVVDFVHRLEVATDVLHCVRFRASRIAVEAAEPDHDGFGRLGAGTHLVPHLAIAVEIGLYVAPFLERKQNHPCAQFGEKWHRLGRHAGTVGSALESREGCRPNLTANLLDVFTLVLHIAVAQPVDQRLGTFGEDAARVVHIDLPALHFEGAQAAADAQDVAALGVMIQQ